MTTSRHPIDETSVAAYFNRNTLALDISNAIVDMALHLHLIRNAGDDDCERVAKIVHDLTDTGADMFLTDPVAVYGNPTTNQKAD